MGDNPGTKWHTLTAERALKELHTRKDGLTEYEARRRLQQYGPNIIKEEKKISPLAIFLRQFRSVLVIILIIAALFSYFLLNELIDAVVILIIVVLNSAFGFIQEFRAQKAVEALKKLTAKKAVVIRGGGKVSVDSSDIVPGDVVVLEEGCIVPADMRLTEIVNLRVDEAPLTGESNPVGKESREIGDVSLAERKNMAYMGTLCTYGRAMGVVTSTGMNTEMGRIAHLLEEVKDEQTPLQKHLASFGRRLGVMIFAISVIIVVVGVVRDIVFSPEPLGSREQLAVIFSIVRTSIALAVAAVPEGLPAVVTITLALGLQRLSKRNAIIKKLPAVETLGSTSVICTDKTGTLTRNEMTVSRIWAFNRMLEVEGDGYKAEGGFKMGGRAMKPLDHPAFERVLVSGALCNNASIEKGDIIGDPTEAALLVSARKAGLTAGKLAGYERVFEVPFSSHRKMMAVVSKAPSGRLLVSVKGAPEIVLSRCSHVLKGGRVSAMGKAERKMILEANSALAGQALRVLAVAYKETGRLEKNEGSVESDLVFAGLQAMIDPPRAEVRKDLEICRKAGIRVVMVTGDNKNTAVAIARQLGLFRKGDQALSGEELDSMDEEQLSSVVERVCVYARVSPEHKLKIVSLLQKHGHVVAMTGDGVNDAPALKKADIGVAMGIKGTDVSKEASDMILADDNFTSIVSAVEEGRAIYDNIRKFVQYLLSSNLGEVMIIFIAMIIGFTDPAASGTKALEIILPLTAIQLLWINLLTDGLPALALGVDPAARGIMERKPRESRDSIMDREMFSDMAVVGALMTAGVLGLFAYHLIYLENGAVKAMTVAFAAVVAFEMVRVQSVRAKYGLSGFSNMKLLAARAMSLILLGVVVYTPQLQEAFNTTALSLWELAEIALVSLSLMAVMGIKQRLSGKNNHPHSASRLAGPE